MDAHDPPLTLAASVRWLHLRGVNVHPNTVRYWMVQQQVPVVLTARKERAIPLSALKHIAECPLCVSRAK